MDITFEDFLILYQLFFSPQAKRSIIISNKYGIYELSHELPKDWAGSCPHKKKKSLRIMGK